MAETIVLNSLRELKRFALEFKQSTRVDPVKYEVLIPCRSDRITVRVGRKTVKDELSSGDVVRIMRMLTPPHSKRG